MTQMIYTPGITFSLEDIVKKNTAKHPFSLIDYWLIFTLILGLHAGIIYYFYTTASVSPPVTAPVAQPVEITLAAPQPESIAIAPPPPSEPEPAPAPETIAEPPPQHIDEVAPRVDKPKAKPKPEAKKSPPRPKPPVQSTPQKPVVSPAPQASQPVAQTAPAQTITPPIANANYLHNPAPDYPESAIDRGQEGVVLLRVQVNAQGKAVTVQIHQSSGVSALDNAALRTVRNWSFVPAKRGNQAISGQVIVPVDFSLNS